SDELAAVLEIFDHNLDEVITDLMQNRLRFNMFVRLFFSTLVVELDRPGLGWRKGKKKGELPECHPRIVKFALQEKFALFVKHAQLELPEALRRAQHYDENLSESHGSPSNYTRIDLSLQFIDSLRALLILQDYKQHQLQLATDLNQVGCFFIHLDAKTCSRFSRGKAVAKSSAGIACGVYSCLFRDRRGLLVRRLLPFLDARKFSSGFGAKF